MRPPKFWPQTSDLFEQPSLLNQRHLLKSRQAVTEMIQGYKFIFKYHFGSLRRYGAEWAAAGVLEH